ncbi:hypothetical protein ACUY3M_07880 [Corynebacterium suicordis]|uniref:Uncharacterized protein n=1 Tax=Corynebacterium suicordis DSM 45110 TaxID=1121369 RepID=A0ABR9ZMR2_9CORY|nr:hypothetical protein [Corynebacterium suicordis]MBF4554244.1 hypothetical protein [Corynebacterium suicordis DSM 45110]MDO5727952.1 hypothetical protein [Bowdeniella nasicola]MDR6276777.1 hypothetical protein [Corynebacterium suicordis]
MTQYRIIDAKKNVIQETELESDEKAYDWFKDESKADDSLGYGLEANVDGEWQFIDQAEGGTNPTGSEN